MRRPRHFVCALAFALTALPSVASAAPYLVYVDDGELAAADGNLALIRKRIITTVETAGIAMPEVISVWTTFPMLGNDIATYIDPRGNDVEGINIPKKASLNPPLRAVLFHNNINVMQKRADTSRAPVEGFASYLFMLEFSHLWGPNIRVPEPDPLELTGFSYHWSFFLDGASPAGGNTWTDNADGTFTVVPRAPKDVTFTPLDLYLMGLAPKEEVGDIVVLTDTVVPPTPTDPLFGGAFSGKSFPWFDTENAPITVQATKRTLSIDDVITANGARVPGAVASATYPILFVLAVPADATAEDITEAKAAFDPLVAALPIDFHRATSERGSLAVTDVAEGQGGAGGGATTTTTSSGEGGAMNTPLDPTSSCSCDLAPTTNGTGLIAALGGLIGALLVSVRRKRAA